MIFLNCCRQQLRVFQKHFEGKHLGERGDTSNLIIVKWLYVQ